MIKSRPSCPLFFFFSGWRTTEINTLSLHYALPISICRVEETRCTLDFPWLCPPFPASCPFRSIMAHRGLPPHRPHRADFPQRVRQADSPPLLRSLLLIRGR